MLDVDKSLAEIGTFGLWQLWVYFWLLFMLMFNAAVNVAIVFMQDIPDFMCANPLTTLTDWTFDEIRSISTPKLSGDGDKFDGCKRYIRNYTDFSNMTFQEASDMLENNTAHTESCNSGPYQWHTRSTGMELSIVNQWTLVCDQAFQVSNAATIYMAGYFVGCLVASFLADRFGRKMVIIIAGFLAAALAVVDAYIPNLYGFLVIRFVMSFFLNVVSPTLYVLALELCVDSFRKIMAAVYWVAYAAGYTLLALVAYLVKDWRIMHAVVAAPMLIAPLLYWLIPESPRWLVSQGREKEAIKIFEQAKRWNKIKPDDQQSVPHDEEPNGESKSAFEMQAVNETQSDVDRVELETTNFFVVFKHWRLALRTLNIFLLWCVSSFGYYGLSYLITSFSGNIFVNNAISGGLEIPAYLLCYVLLLWARKKSWGVCFLIAGVTCLLYLAVPKNVEWAQLLVTFIGKLAISSGDNLKYVVAVELYPTSIRGAAVSLSSMCSRAGAMVSPWVVLIAQKNESLIWISMVIFGGTSLAAGVLAFFLPESQNQPLPETLEETIHYPPKNKKKEVENKYCCCLTNLNLDMQTGTHCKQVIFC